MQADYENERQKLDADLLKNNLDKTLLLAKALKSGTKAICSTNISEIKYTKIDTKDTASVLAQAFAGFNSLNRSLTS